MNRSMLRILTNAAIGLVLFAITAVVYLVIGAASEWLAPAGSGGEPAPAHEVDPGAGSGGAP